MESSGTRLKNVRLQKGLSLEDVHKKTKIHLNILKALEEDSLVNFSPVYIKGFLKIYCKFLGIDPHDCIPNYKEPNAEFNRVSDSKEKPASSFKMPRLKFFPFKGIRINPKLAIIVVLTIVFIAVLFNLGKFISLKLNQLPKKNEMPVIVSLSKPQAKAPVARVHNLPAVKTITLDIYTKESCYIKVKADGRVIFQNILKKGRSESWQAKDRIELSLGSAGAVELEVNGKRISGLGRKGQALKNILITKEGLNVKR